MSRRHLPLSSFFVASLDQEMVDQLESLGPKIVMNGPIVRQLCVWEWTYCTPAMSVGVDLL